VKNLLVVKIPMLMFGIGNGEIDIKIIEIFEIWHLRGIQFVEIGRHDFVIVEFECFDRFMINGVTETMAVGFGM
jgi:hypothetical protein